MRHPYAAGDGQLNPIRHTIRAVWTISAGALLCAGSLLVARPAAAECGSSLFGSAALQNGAVRVTSNTGSNSTTDDFGGVRLQLPSGTTFRQPHSPEQRLQSDR